MYTLYQLGEYLGLSSEHEARDQLAALTPHQRWIQWTRFDAGSRIRPQQCNRSRDREHRRQGGKQRGWQHGNTYQTVDVVPDMQGGNHEPVGWHRDGQRQPSWERSRPQERRHHNSVPYTPPHKRGTHGLRDKTYVQHNRDSQGRRIPTIDHRSQAGIPNRRKPEQQ